MTRLANKIVKRAQEHKAHTVERDYTELNIFNDYYFGKHGPIEGTKSEERVGNKVFLDGLRLVIHSENMDNYNSTPPSPDIYVNMFVIITYNTRSPIEKWFRDADNQDLSFDSVVTQERKMELRKNFGKESGVHLLWARTIKLQQRQEYNGNVQH